MLQNGNPHLDQETTVWGSDSHSARAAVLAVHGRGQTPEFMREQSARLSSSGLRFYAPSAYENSWYPHPFLEPVENNQPALANSIEALRIQLAAIEAEGFSTGRIVLWGFSQGACLLSQLLLTEPAAYAASIIFTGGYLGRDEASVPANEPLKGVPILMRSIESDPWVPRWRVQQTARVLLASGADVDLRIDPGSEHIITEQSMSDASWILDQLPSLPESSGTKDDSTNRHVKVSTNLEGDHQCL
ncbi:dienelactone hydrolase family protein [Rhodococcus sp. UFZ-B548]|uniref:alpha/beta hydrolase n=1 Tax=Rhodococcus sp. UFZ-B548 TaxID=2742212 RepID=UPI0015F41B80